MQTANLAIMFTDIVGYTAGTARRTRAEQAQWQQRHDQLLVPIFKAFAGRVVKSIGDAYLVTFLSPTDAVLCGTAIQDALAIHNHSAVEDNIIRVRVVVNMGEVRVEKGDIFGEPVNIAARIEGIAEAGEVLFTEAVYLAMNKSEVPSESHGEHALKGITEAVRVYRVPPHSSTRLIVADPPLQAQEDGSDLLHLCPYGGHALARLHQGKMLPAFLQPNVVAGQVGDSIERVVRGMSEGFSEVSGRVTLPRAMLGPRHRRTFAVAAVTVAAVLLVWLLWRLLFADPLHAVIRAVDKRDWPSAQQAMQKVRDQKGSESAHALAAHAYFASGKGRSTIALQNYQRALQQNTDLCEIRELIIDIVAYLDDNEARARALLQLCRFDRIESTLSSSMSSADNSYAVRLASAAVLGGQNMGKRRSMRALALEVLERSEKCQQRRQAVELLGDVGETADLELLQALTQAPSGEQENPLQILSRMGEQLAQNACLGAATQSAIRKIKTR